MKQDAVPTIAYSDSFGEGGGSGTLGYYLASAFDQVYVQETGLVSFTGLPAAPHVLSLKRLHTSGMSCSTLPCVTLALYDLLDFASLNLVPYASILLSDLPADAVMVKPDRQLLSPCVYRRPQQFIAKFC